MAKSIQSFGSQFDNMAFGQTLRRSRKDAGFTLVQLSEKSGVSRAALSKIERGEISPTYSTLRKIAHGLDLTVAALVMSEKAVPSTEIELVRASSAAKFSAEQYAYSALAGSAAGLPARCFVSQIRARSVESFEAFHTHNTKDVIYILSGRVVAHFEGRAPVELRVGDSLYFDGQIPHAFVNGNDQPSSSDKADDYPSVLWISYANKNLAL